MHNPEYDILPIERNEALPVNLSGDGDPYAYPEALLLSDGLDADQLARDFEQCRNLLPDRFVNDRAAMLARGLDVQSVLRRLAEYGFTKDTYKPYPMRKLGSNELLECIPAYTREVLERVSANLFRQQYLIARPGWETTVHVDHYSFRIHGLRLHIPITAACYLAFPQESGEERTYVLRPGEMWFINPGRPHRGFNPEPVDRVIIQAQMDRDDDVLAAMKNA